MHFQWRLTTITFTSVPNASVHENFPSLGKMGLFYSTGVHELVVYGLYAMAQFACGPRHQCVQLTRPGDGTTIQKPRHMGQSKERWLNVL